MISVDPTKGLTTMSTRKCMLAAGLGLAMVLATASAPTPASADQIYVSLSAGGKAGPKGPNQVRFKDEDILVFDNEEPVAADA